MSAGPRRTMVDCAVLSLQDLCVFYPSCKSCFSRIDVPQNTTRCSRCGCSCVRGQVDYRYRLSLRVTRDTSIFGITVFGHCLNPFFGIHANGLQRLLENTDGPAGASTRSTLLVKAVKDCFIGRRFIFGITVAETESGSLLGGHTPNGSSSKDMVQYIASQMIPSKAPGQGGCSVINYYQILLQKAAEYPSIDPSKTHRFLETTPLTIPLHQSPANSFKNASLSTSGLLGERSLFRHCSPTSTPSWNQSLGLVTSSAEQEEGSNSQDSWDEKSKENGCLQNPKVHSPLLSLDNSLSFTKYPYSSVDKAVGNTPILNTWFRMGFPLSQQQDLPLNSKAKGFSTRTITKTYLSNSVVWEDLPFSERLSEFLCEGNNDFDRPDKTDLNLNMKNHIGIGRNYLRISSQNKTSSIQSIFSCQSNADMTERHSDKESDINNTTNIGGDGCDLSDQADQEQASNTCSDECDQEDEKAFSLSVENNEAQLEDDVYNCSADLFSSSTTDINTEILSIPAETEACPPVYSSDKQKLKSSKSIKDRTATSDMTQCEYLQSLDFIPSSQSTPIVKVGATCELGSQSNWKDSCAFHRNLLELVSKSPARMTSFPCKLNYISADQHGSVSTKHKVFGSTSSRCRFGQKRKFWKPDQCEHQRQHQRIQSSSLDPLNMASKGKRNCKCDSSVCDVTVFDYDNEGIVPPTPAAKKQVRIKPRRKMQTDNSSCSLGWRCEEVQQPNGVYWHKNEACDWSRDMFSDSLAS